LFAENTDTKLVKRFQSRCFRSVARFVYRYNASTEQEVNYFNFNLVTFHSCWIST